MRRASPEQAGYTPGAPLPAVGRAERFRCGEGQELWCLPLGGADPAHDEALGRRLLALGGHGIGGFVDGGVIEEKGAAASIWLVRRLASATLADRLRARRDRWPVAESLALGRAIARSLAACEAASLFPGPLSPDALVVDDAGDAMIPAGSLIAALVGAASDARGSVARVSHEIAPLWTPPAQADGAVWDSAANRYVLGLILYRLIAGAHPFSGAGLRHALGEAARREPPPFAEPIARTLPAGLQSFVLRLVDPDPGRRPPHAEAIAAALRGYLDEREAAPPPRARLDARSARRAMEPRRRAEQLAADQAPPPRSPVDPAASAPRSPAARWLRLVPLAAGAAVAIGALSLSLAAREPRSSRAPTAIPPRSALTPAQTTAQDCAACHSRQASEWRRSVMAHSVKSPLFNALESLIQEQVGRDAECPNGAGILRKADPTRACRDRSTGVPVTGAGGEHWCVNCHSPAENLDAAMPSWDGRRGGDRETRFPVRDILTARGLEGISCGFCHQVHGPVGPRSARGYQGNATWTSFATGNVFAARPEDARGLFGIANSGYELRPSELLLGAPGRRASRPAGVPESDEDPVVHARPEAAAAAYLRSSEFCGACHDVRLFGTDSLGAARGEHFKRLRNAYSEWASWAKAEERAGRRPATCQDCHMSTYPGVCMPVAAGASASPSQLSACPPGTRFEERPPGSWPRGRVADGSSARRDVSTHYFSGVDVPLSAEFPDALIDERSIDAHGIPLGARRRRDLLLRHTFRFGLGAPRRRIARGGPPAQGDVVLEIPVEIENVGAGHRVPAGFSQEREFWVHLVVRDGTGRIIYEVGRVDRNDEDLRDKEFIRVTTRPDANDPLLGARGGLFGADVRDGADVPRWSPNPLLGGTSFRGDGLINFQNGFLRCVRCIGQIASDGSCHPRPGQGLHRADRFADGDYDIDTGACGSNLTGHNAFFETYFPVGALDASRGAVKGPDAIIDTRSIPPGAPLRYTYELPTGGRRGPFRIEARLLFRAFPPFLIRAFASYEREQFERGLRPSGPLVTEAALARLEVVELAQAEAEIP